MAQVGGLCGWSFEVCCLLIVAQWVAGLSRYVLETAKCVSCSSLISLSHSHGCFSA